MYSCGLDYKHQHWSIKYRQWLIQICPLIHTLDHRICLAHTAWITWSLEGPLHRLSITEAQAKVIFIWWFCAWVVYICICTRSMSFSIRKSVVRQYLAIWKIICLPCIPTLTCSFNGPLYRLSITETWKGPEHFCVIFLSFVMHAEEWTRRISLSTKNSLIIILFHHDFHGTSCLLFSEPHRSHWWRSC